MLSSRSHHAYEVAGRVLSLRIVENPRAIRLTLHIETRGQGLRITVPPGLPAYEIDYFLSRHANWIEAHITNMPIRPTVRPGIKIPIRGVAHLLVHKPGKQRTVEVIRDENNTPLLIINADHLHFSRYLVNFLKREAKHDMDILVARHTSIVGKSAKAIRYKDTKSRWGSCSSDGILSFSWRIVMAPPSIVNYLVAHEVAHLIEMNHSPKFWKLCKELCSNTERCKTWLKRNGNTLQMIDFS